MKTWLSWVFVALMGLALLGCQQGQKTGWVNCCVPQSDGTKKCVQMEPGQCSKVGAAVTNCDACK